MTETRPYLVAAKGRPSTAATGTAVAGAALFAIVVWAGTPIATKVAVSGFDAALVAMMRSVGAGLLLLPLAVFRPAPAPASPGAWALLVASALGGFVAFPLLFAFGLRLTTVSHAALILAAQPMFTVIIGALVERRWPGARWAFGCAIAFAGEVALIGFRFGLEAEGGIAGDLLLLAAGLAASVGYVTGSRLSLGIGTWGTTLWGNILGAALLVLPLAWRGAAADWGAVGFTVWGSILYLALGSSVIGYVAWYWALAKGGVARIGAAQFAMPVMTLGLAVVMLGERLSLPLALAGAVIVAGIYLAQKR
jgi:drug/metabolite transporter (DMT)-like permease